MNSTATWYQANLQYLLAAVDHVRQFLKFQIAHAGEKRDSNSLESFMAQDFPVFNYSEPSTLDSLCTLFGLSPFERDILLLCLGMELDPSFGALCGSAQGSQELAFPTFALALSVLKNGDLRAIAPVSPLQHWLLLEIEPRQTLTLSPLKLNRRILFYLLGQSGLEQKLTGYIHPLQNCSSYPLPPSYQHIVTEMIHLWTEGGSISSFPAIQLCGSVVADKYAIAAAACEQIGFRIYRLAINVLPVNPSELFYLKRYWEREALLTNSLLLLECEEISQALANNNLALWEFLEGLNLPFIVSSTERISGQWFSGISFEVPQLSHTEQQELWHTHLGEDGVNLNGHVNDLVSQFNLGATAITSICHQFKLSSDKMKINEEDQPILPPNSEKSNPLWDFCLAQVRPRLEDLAQRIEATATWDDLVLPEQEKNILADITVHLRQRTKIYREWGFAHKSNRGLGINVLFHGASGTGKTMAAEVLANEFHLELYRIDLSTVVSKYIGETEKNLRRIFDAAETGGAILLFDEADAIFAKRTEVKDSHDRYANIEVSYLLQRMETYGGLSILTTNLKNSLDKAFERRLRFVICFPFPDAQARTLIWSRIFPAKTPTQALDFQKLGRLNVAGGNIQNIALNAAFLAADENEPVKMKHILRAAQREYIKIEKTMPESEIKGWNLE